MNKCLSFQLLAELFKYPSSGLIDKVVAYQSILEKDNPDACMMLGKFLNFLFDTPMSRIEEIYIRSSHVQAIPYLNLFYENYRIVLKMNREIRYSFPGNFVKALSLLPATKERDYREELTTQFIIPAIWSILDDFQTNSTSSLFHYSSETKDNNHKADKTSGVYRYAFKALLTIFEKEYAKAHLTGEVSCTFNINPLITIQNDRFRQLGFYNFWISRN